MKRLLTLFLLIVALFVSATGCSVSGRIVETGFQREMLSGNSIPTEHSFLVVKKHLLSQEQEVSHTSYDFRSHYPAKRIFPDSPNAFRQKRDELQIRRQFSSVSDKCDRRAAIAKGDGYYLYHLRKLLI